MVSNEIKTQTRTRIGTGSADFLADVDGRSLVARRFREISSDMTSDLGGELTAAQNQLVRRAATLAIQAELMEICLANGETFDTDTYCRLTNTLGRVLGQLGLKRMAKDVTPAALDPHSTAIIEGAHT